MGGGLESREMAKWIRERKKGRRKKLHSSVAGRGRHH